MNFVGLVFVDVARPRKLIPNKNFCVYGMCIIVGVCEILVNEESEGRVAERRSGPSEHTSY